MLKDFNGISRRVTESRSSNQIAEKTGNVNLPGQNLLGLGDFSVVKSVKSCQSCCRTRGLFFPLIKFSKRSGKNRSRTGRDESLEQLVSLIVGISGPHVNVSSCSKFKMKATQQHEESANLSTAYLLALKMQELRFDLNKKNEEFSKACVLSSRH